MILHNQATSLNLEVPSDSDSDCDSDSDSDSSGSGSDDENHPANYQLSQWIGYVLMLAKLPGRDWWITTFEIGEYVSSHVLCRLQF